MAQTSAVKLTYADYLLIPDDGKRHEIIDGEHYVSPAPNARHQEILVNLILLLGIHVRQHRLGKVFAAPFDVVLSEINVFQPDLVFISTARLAVLTLANVKGAPDLAVEILSPGTRRVDETKKYAQYDKFGVTEYWIVDGDTETVRVHRREDGALKLTETVEGEGASFRSPLFPGLEIELAEIFA